MIDIYEKTSTGSLEFATNQANMPNFPIKDSLHKICSSFQTMKLDKA